MFARHCWANPPDTQAEEVDLRDCSLSHHQRGRLYLFSSQFVPTINRDPLGKLTFQVGARHNPASFSLKRRPFVHQTFKPSPIWLMSCLMIASYSPHRFSVAPMMDWTDRHDRFFLRQISRRARLYTEMITTQAILRGDRARLLDFDAAEHSLALQIGGAEPDAMAACARIAEDWGYEEVNINVGCPSDRVQSGRFGACLMREPDVVAECVVAMRGVVSIPVTVKCRIGVDDQEPGEVLPSFVEKVAAAGCETFIVHARKAWLSGLSPAQNRDVPPLDYPLVHALKRARPDLTISINGGIADLDAALPHLNVLDGVMMGRAAYQTPWVLSHVDQRVFGDDTTSPDRWEVAEAMVEYAARRGAEGVPLKSITRHMMGLFHGLPGARSWRRALGEEVRLSDASPALIRRAALMVRTPDQVAS